MGEARIVADRYTVISELGRGGMGVAWLAEDQVIGRRVALKELSANSLAPAEWASFQQRVLREARAAGQLNDPAVVMVYDVIIEDSSIFLVMELVEAPTLLQVIMDHGPLPADRIIEITRKLLHALRKAHDAGIVHRDVKPSNIMVFEDGTVKLADFGLARATEDTRVTLSGGVAGTPGYIPPELLRGETATPACDLWSLGATLFCAVEGAPPFERDSIAATLHAILYEDMKLTRAEGKLAAVINGLLTRPVNKRLTAEQVLTLLDSPSQPVPVKRRRRGLWIGVAAAVFALLGTTMAFVNVPGTFHSAARPTPGKAPDPTTASSSTSQTPTPQAGSTVAPASTRVSSSSSKTPTTAAGPPPAELPLTPLLRYYNQSTDQYDTTTSAYSPSIGFAQNATLGSLVTNAVPGTRPIYRCSNRDFFIALDENCGGAGHGDRLGWVYFPNPPSGRQSRELHHCARTEVWKMPTHFASNSAGCEGLTHDYFIGYVV